MRNLRAVLCYCLFAATLPAIARAQDPAPNPPPEPLPTRKNTPRSVFKKSGAEWFIFGSSTGFGGAVTLGAPGDVPVPGDYDGDDKADLAVFRD